MKVQKLFHNRFTVALFVLLIIEPDNSKPWSYNGWLETVIADGTIISTVALPTGHIIQKRTFPS